MRYNGHKRTRTRDSRTSAFPLLWHLLIQCHVLWRSSLWKAPFTVRVHSRGKVGAQFIPPKSARTSSVSRRELSEFQVCKPVRLASLKLWDHCSRFYTVHTETTSFVLLSNKASVSRYKPRFKETGSKTHRSKGKPWVNCDLPGDWYGVIGCRCG